MNPIHHPTHIICLSLMVAGLSRPAPEPIPVTPEPVFVQETTDDLGPERMERLIEELATAIEERYIFEDIGKEIGALLRQQLWNGAYEGIRLRIAQGETASASVGIIWSASLSGASGTK